MAMEKSRLSAELSKYIRTDENGKKVIECSDAYKAAYACQVKIEEVAKEINDNNIKIIKCQLGCF